MIKKYHTFISNNLLYKIRHNTLNFGQYYYKFTLLENLFMIKYICIIIIFSRENKYMIKTSSFGKTSRGEQVYAFCLSDGVNEAIILNYGGIIHSIKIIGKDGNPIDIVLGYNDIQTYENNPLGLGGIIGRFAGKIENGRFSIDGENYDLLCNKGSHHADGGIEGFHTKIWQHVFEGPAGNTLSLSYTSPANEENYPGLLRVQVNYTLEKGELRIDYMAMADKKTPINLTNYTCFNLNGESSGTILDTIAQINADKIVTTNDDLIPNGSFKSVENTPFEFLTQHRIGERINDTNDRDIMLQGGYDTTYLLNKKKDEFTKIAEFEGSRTGILMEIYTNKPALYFYTGQALNNQGKSTTYGRNTGFIAAPVFLPGAIGIPAYAFLGDPVYNRGQIYRFTTSYKFSIRN